MIFERIEQAILIFGVAAMVALWYALWVKPTDEFRYQVMECMQEIQDHSETGYVHCVKKLRK